MAREREPLFGAGQGDEIGDLSDFAPKPRPEPPDRPAIRALAEGAGFRSREPQTGPALRSSAITGRNTQINLKARPETILLFSAIAERHDWSKALTFERAVAALRRLLEDGVDPKSLDLDP